MPWRARSRWSRPLFRARLHRADRLRLRRPLRRGASDRKRRPARRSGQWRRGGARGEDRDRGSGRVGPRVRSSPERAARGHAVRGERLAGGHTNTVRVDPENETHHVDTGFIVHNDRNYPGFERLLDRLGVATQPSEMSFSVSDGADFEYNGASPNGLFARRSHLARPSFHRMVRDLLRFNREAPSLIGLNGDGALARRVPRRRAATRASSCERLIVPQASAVWSADPASMWEFPASMLAEFFDNHGMFGLNGRPSWLTVSRRLATATWRRSSSRSASGCGSRPRSCGSSVATDRVELTPAGGEPERFDEVVLAAHSDQALRMLADPSRRRGRGARRDPLSAERGRAPHRPLAAAAAPARLGELELPPRERADRPDDRDLPHEPPPIAARRARAVRDAQPTEAIDPDKVIETIRYDAPRLSRAAGLAAQRRWSEVSGVRRT